MLGYKSGILQLVRRKDRFMVRSSGMVILFDIDGTLIDHDTAETIAVAALGGRMEHTDDAVGFLQRWRSAFERHYTRYLAGELSIQEQRRENPLLEKYGPPRPSTPGH